MNEEASRFKNGRGITVTMAVRDRKCESRTVPILSNEKKRESKNREKKETWIRIEEKRFVILF